MIPIFRVGAGARCAFGWQVAGVRVWLLGGCLMDLTYLFPVELLRPSRLRQPGRSESIEVEPKVGPSAPLKPAEGVHAKPRNVQLRGSPGTPLHHNLPTNLPTQQPNSISFKVSGGA